MPAMRSLNQHLQQRGGRWHYVRRVPNKYTDIDKRGMIRTALGTSSLEVARARRDSMVEADEQYWASLALQTIPLKADTVMHKRYEAAQRRAMARGFIYTPIQEMTATATVEELLERLGHAEKHEDRKSEVEAVMGGVDRPLDKISQAFELYCTKLAIGELTNKSADQQRKWRLAKQRAVLYFTDLCGDLPMDQITRQHARKFYDWWGRRLLPNGKGKPLRPNSANRDLGNLRKLYREYWVYQGEEERENPFRNLRFKDKPMAETKPFSDDWVRSKILEPQALKGIHPQSILLVYSLIETGCRPSEIANLRAENIILDAPVPHIRIRAQLDRELKSAASRRDIPLVGISLKALQHAPNGFPHYRDRSALLSNTLMKIFRNRGLFPSEQHRIYSFRHAFEKRMLEAGLDYGLRCLLMGHQNTRPQYGDGGSLEYRRDELLKIVHPFSKPLTQSLPELTV